MLDLLVSGKFLMESNEKKEKNKTEPNNTPKTKAITTRIGEHILLFPYKIDE